MVVDGANESITMAPGIVDRPQLQREGHPFPPELPEHAREPLVDASILFVSQAEGGHPDITPAVSGNEAGFRYKTWPREPPRHRVERDWCEGLTSRFVSHNWIEQLAHLMQAVLVAPALFGERRDQELLRRPARRGRERCRVEGGDV